MLKSLDILSPIHDSSRDISSPGRMKNNFYNKRESLSGLEKTKNIGINRINGIGESNGTNERTLGPRISTLNSRREPIKHQLQSTSGNLRRLFQSHIENDPVRCAQAWKIVSENEWKNGLSLHDVGPNLKEWIQLCIVGIVHYSDSKQRVPQDKLDQTLNNTENLLKSTIQSNGGARSQLATGKLTLKEHLLRETVLFRNMDGDQFHNSLRQLESRGDKKSEASSFHDNAENEENLDETWEDDIEQDVNQRQEVEEEFIQTSSDFPILTKENPFYQILKEFLEVACIPLQIDKSSDKLLKERKYAELLEILGYITMNTIQWDTICLRTLRAIISIFQRSSSVEDQNLPTSHQLDIQRRYLNDTKLILYITVALEKFYSFKVQWAATNLGNENVDSKATNSLEGSLPPKIVDILTEFLFLFNDFSNLFEGAKSLSTNGFIIALVQIIETTILNRNENVPQYIHLSVDVINNLVSYIVQEDFQQDLNASKASIASNTSTNAIQPHYEESKRSLTPIDLEPSLPKSIDRVKSNEIFLTKNASFIVPQHIVQSLLSYLSSLVQQLHETATKIADHHLKNDILSILLKLSYVDQYRPYFQDIGLIGFICQYFQSEVSYEPSDSHLKSSPNKYSPPNHETEYVILMWNIIVSLSFYEPLLQHILEEGFVAILLNYVDITCKYLYCISKWTEDQIREIRLNALQALFFYSTMAPEVFCANAGCETLVEFIVALNQETENNITDPSEDVVLMNKITSILVNISSTQSGCQELIEKGCFPQLFDLSLKDSITIENEDLTTFIKRRIDLLDVIARISCYDPRMSLEQFNQLNGVQKLHRSLINLSTRNQLLSQQEKDDLIYQLLITLWTCTIGHEVEFEENEIQFILEDGVRTLLDLIDTSIEYIQYSCLGFLSDILVHEDAIHSFNQWMSKSNKKTATSMLVNLWNNEAVQRANSKKRDSELSSKFGCLRSDLDFRLRIHIVLSHVHFQDQCPSRELSNSSQVNQDEIILCEIAAYSDTLNSLAWSRVSQELETENVRPTTPDSELLEKHRKELVQIEDQVQKAKSNIKQRMKQNELQQESEFFDYIKHIVDSKLQEQKLVKKTVSIVEQKRLKDKLKSF